MEFAKIPYLLVVIFDSHLSCRFSVTAYSSVALQLRPRLLLPLQHGVNDATRFVYRFVHLLVLTLHDALWELGEVESEIVLVGHRHVYAGDLHAQTNPLLVLYT